MDGDVAVGRERGGRLAGPPAEDDRLGERVAAQPVRAVQAGGALAGGVQADAPRWRGSRARRRCRPSSSARWARPPSARVEMSSIWYSMNWRYMRGSFVRMSVLARVGDVEEHAAVRPAPALGDLRVVGQRHPVAGAQLHPLRVVAGHEPLAVGVVETAALAAHGLGHEHAGGLLGRDHAGRVELDELHVHHPAAGPQREGHRLAEVLVTARGAAPPDAGVAAAAQHDGVGHERRAAPVVQVEGERTEAGAVGDQQPRDVVLLDDRYAELGDLGGQRVQDRPARVVAGVARAPPAVGAEEPLIEATVVGAGERASPLGQLLDGRRRLARHDLDDARIAEQVALRERVGEVLLPRVLRVAGAEGGVDPSRRQHGVGVEPRPLARRPRPRPRPGGRRSRPAARPRRSRSRGRSPCGCGQAHDQPWVQRDRSAPGRRGRSPRRLRWCQHACGAGRVACDLGALRAAHLLRGIRRLASGSPPSDDSRGWSSSNGQHPTPRSERCESW